MTRALGRFGCLAVVTLAATATWSACEDLPSSVTTDSPRIAKTVRQQATPPESGRGGGSPTALLETGAALPAEAPLFADGLAAWRGLTVASEHRCSPYDADDYRYPQFVEPRIVAGMGGIVYGPYTGTWFVSTSETDIEHILARSEAHDSGLCAAGI